MIFLTVGTHEPFDRLVRVVDQWCAESRCGDQVFGQITSRGAYVPRHFEYVPRLSPAEYERCARGAQLIVAHAGMGSIITAMTFHKRILVMPRRGHLGETRNDHQYATIERLEGMDGIVVARDERELSKRLITMLSDSDAGTEPAILPFADVRLLDTIREWIASPERTVESARSTER